MMWSNFNDSFTALTGHISTQLRQTIPTIQSSFGDHSSTDQQQQQQQDVKLRELDTKISLLRKEVVRHRNIAQMYKDRWLEAENVCKEVTGNCSKIYDDDVNLLDDEDDDEILNDDSEIITEQQPPTTIANEPLLIDLKNKLIIVEQDESNDNNVDKHQSSPSAIIVDGQPIKQTSSSSSLLPKCVSDLRLDSSIQQIHLLQDEIRKLNADGEHWRKLAKQKSSVEESQQNQLELLQNKLKICQNDCKNYEQLCDELRAKLSTIEQESLNQLQQLDQLHDEEKNKLLTLRDRLIDENQSLRLEVEQLKQSNSCNNKNSNAKDENFSYENIGIQTDCQNENITVDVAIQTEKNNDDSNYNINQIVEKSSKYIDLSELNLQFDDHDDKQKFQTIKIVVELLCERIDRLNDEQNKKMMTSDVAVGEDDSKLARTFMTLHQHDHVSHQMLTHDGDYSNNIGENDDHSHHRHLMNELEKLSQQKIDLEQKCNELQSRLEWYEQQTVNKQQQLLPQTTTETVNADNSLSSSLSALSDQKSFREEPEGANNNDSDTVLQDGKEAAEQNQLINELEAKLSKLTLEFDDLHQRFHSSQNENHIFERRYKETEEESVKIQHRLHQIEQERDLLQIRLIETEKSRDSINEELKNVNSRLLTQCESYEKLLIEVGTLNEQNEELKKKLNQLTEDNERLRSSLAIKDDELIRLNETIVDQQKNESTESSEVEKLSNELTRLRQHLVQVEETYLGYLKEAEERLEQSQQIVRQYEQMNIDQKEAEHQMLVQSLRNELEKSNEQLHQLEDKNERLAANLVNMQSVIDQLEKEHERKIRSLNDEHHKQKMMADQREDEWRRRLQLCEERLRETRQALEAASRLTEQIECKEMLIEQIKREVENKDQEITKLKRELEQSQEGKVDKQIVKNLVLSYLATPADKRSDAERLLARFLDFNQEEMNRVGIRVGRDAAAADKFNSFTSSFVQFLETESSPDKKTPTSERRSSNVSVNSPQQMELARDLNKRLNQQETSINNNRMASINPFVGYTTPVTTSSYPYSHNRHSRTSSQSSTSDVMNQTNQLLTNIIIPPASNIPEIVHNVIEKDKYI